MCSDELGLDRVVRRFWAQDKRTREPSRQRRRKSIERIGRRE